MRAPIAVTTAAAICFSTAALAQSQQAGNEASTNADETFKQLVEKCDDTDALVLRARIRLAMGRLDDTAAVELTKLTNEGLSLCGEGKLDEAKAALNKTLAAAEAKVTEKFGQDETAEVKAAKPEATDNTDSGKVADTENEKKPWWKFW